VMGRAANRSCQAPCTRGEGGCYAWTRPLTTRAAFAYQEKS
jgi:hypothetical protein